MTVKHNCPECKKLVEALVEAASVLEVLTCQIEQQPYRELSDNLQSSIAQTTHRVRETVEEYVQQHAETQTSSTTSRAK